MMRVRFAVPALFASLTLHVAAATLFLPDTMEAEVQGGNQATVLTLGTDKLDALMEGAETVEATATEVVTSAPTGESASEAVAEEPLNARETTASTLAAQRLEAEQIVRPSIETTEPQQSESSGESVAGRQLEVVQAEAGKLVSAPEPLENVTAEPDVPLPRPAPRKQKNAQGEATAPVKAEQAKRKPETSRSTVKRSKATSAKKQAAAKKAKKTERKNKSRKAAARGGSGGRSTANAKRRSSGAKTRKAVRTRGNASASNYPGMVYAKISRTRRKSLGRSGTASVRFTVSASGRLVRASIARSSGNARIDTGALSHVRRSAPFPKPPPGARKTFVIPIEFRN